MYATTNSCRRFLQCPCLERGLRTPPLLPDSQCAALPAFATERGFKRATFRTVVWLARFKKQNSLKMKQQMYQRFSAGHGVRVSCNRAAVSAQTHVHFNVVRRQIDTTLVVKSVKNSGNWLDDKTGNGLRSSCGATIHSKYGQVRQRRCDRGGAVGASRSISKTNSLYRTKTAIMPTMLVRKRSANSLIYLLVSDGYCRLG